MKLLVVEDLLRGIEEVQQQVRKQQEQLNQVEVSITSFLQTKHLFTGAAASAIRSFYEQCHLPFLQFLHLSFLQYDSTLDQIKQSISQYEPSTSGVVREQFIEIDVQNGLAQLEQATSQLTSSTNKVMQSVSDLVYLPPLSDKNVQQDIIEAKKQANDTVEQLNELDYQTTTSLNTLEADLALMNNYLQEIQSAFQVSKGQATFNGTALHFSPASLLLNSSLASRHRQSNPFTHNPLFLSKSPVNFDKWHNPLAYYTQLNAALTPTNKDGKEEWRNGEIKWESGNGKMAITKGESFDAAAYLGREPNMIRAGDIEVRYDIVDGKFIIFKDNPNYWYFTQNAQQGTVNYYTGLAAQKTADFYGAWLLGKTASKIPKAGGIVTKIDEKYNPVPVGTAGAAFSAYVLQEKIPLWGEIIGTPVPAAGTKEVLVYLSEDEEDWTESVKLLFKLSPDGTISVTPPDQ
ncbi:LXG domain-containing protein [Alkalihalophilus marmarensis]|uniref:LXG domain-containing protein n=1 Tax=Alkalihalophilus marmarensis TaxID=521377 RepID=UPI002DBE9918|nr:LXG domain-containing protein [Alkalihalophilus marmarensis]MEC2074307.1 LXG domain-containing protein [Alkalihalophilus marmarensis]